MEIKTIHSELKSLCQEVVASDSTDRKALTAQVEKIYEKLLLLDFLDQRQQKFDALSKKLANQIEGSELPTTTIEEPQEAFQTEELETIHSEIKVLPHPEGPPPTKQKDLEESIIEIQKEEEKQMHKGAQQEMFEESKDKKESKKESEPSEVKKKEVELPKRKQSIAEKAEANSTGKSLNQRLSNASLKIGLNDRIAFVKHLFNGNQDDFNRVLSQVNTFQSLDEVEQFIEHIVKPEYSWGSKEEYEERFMEIVRSKF